MCYSCSYYSFMPTDIYIDNASYQISKHEKQELIRAN